MQNIITEKVPGGKLVRIKADYGAIINKIQITGDFFLHPEDTIEQLEESVRGAGIPVDSLALQQKIDAVITSKKITLIGITSADISRLIAQAVNR